jgi:predicted dithiol-disulfide oxidoreductase (DUF899 family)
MEQTRLTESEEYAARREELRLAEIELVRQRERVAVLRRALPPGAVVEDYVFQEGPRDLASGDATVSEVRLAELFTDPGRALVVYHLMYGKAQTTPCPMCTMWIDGFNGVASHLARNVDFVIAAAAGPGPLRAHARSRGWYRLRLLSCAGNTFKHDLGSEAADGSQHATVSVFTLDPDGSPRHVYTAHPDLAEDQQERGIDLLSPVWHILDLTPAGRGDWYASLDYGPVPVSR